MRQAVRTRPNDRDGRPAKPGKPGKPGKSVNSRLSGLAYLGLGGATLVTLLLCLCVGSVSLPLGETLSTLWKLLRGEPLRGMASGIIASVRLPRVLCVALSGAALSLCGAAMQGLMRNPLADGSTMGVSAGASLGAVLSIALGLSLPGLSGLGTLGMAMGFAFGSLMLILSLSYAMDRSLATHTMILVGVVFTMFASSLVNLVTVFAGERVKSVTFWTMGSLAGSNPGHVWTLLLALVFCGGGLLYYGNELNALSLGEAEARQLGVPVKRVKLTVMVLVSVLIGVCCSIGGNIGFVGLVTPHLVRMWVGPNHKKLLPASAFSGAVFLMLADLLARTVISPIELPIGVVTSLIGSVFFVVIFYRTRKARRALC